MVDAKGRSVGTCLVCHRWVAVTEDTMLGKTGPVCHRCQVEKPTPAQVRAMMVERIHECRQEILNLEKRIRNHDAVHGA